MENPFYDPNTLTVDNIYPDNKSSYGDQRYISNIPGDNDNPLYTGIVRPQLTNVFNATTPSPTNPDNVVNNPPGALDENIFYNNQNYLYSELGFQALSSQDVLNPSSNPNPSPDIASAPTPGSPFEGAADSIFAPPSTPLP